MAAELLLLLLGLSAGPGLSSGSGPDSERGRMELRRVRSLAAQPRYGGCWARALENLDMRCRDLTSESQSRIALRFTLCHLSSSGRDFPSCSEGSEVSRCTGAMDAVAFNTYTEFFTHTHSICHFLQSEAWQSRAENTMYRLTESSAGVAEQLQSTRQMAEDLIDAQSAALQAQQEILNNGEELRVTLRDSTQGLRSVFSELSSVSREQQVALSELFNRVSFLQSFLLMEAHSLSSCCYNAAALCTSFLLTSTQRSSRARDPVQQSLQVLQQLRETQRGLQEALQHAECLRERQRRENQLDVKRRSESRRREETPTRRKEIKREEEEEEEECSTLVSLTADGSDLSHLSHIGWSTDSILSSTVNSTLQSNITHNASVQSPTTHNASVHPGRRPRPSSPLVYSVLVEDKQPRYSLRSRRSETR
ncbi:uncharacterized protein LOC122882959 isoform X3 [Siniperca chuatsi]|uniref:uncharacterized protein LOC122882959 isoform X3 n=1 Tax=Siniperca chuatsi TaxID=119488 RepID=UPI001CE1CF6F|nr:uncharacterized protein LOC122882959 isoform X3 [Siniperca chuatsi]